MLFIFLRILYLNSDTIKSSEISLGSDGFVHDIIALAVPALMSQSIEPIAQLLETAYVGRLGNPFFLFKIKFLFLFLI